MKLDLVPSLIAALALVSVVNGVPVNNLLNELLSVNPFYTVSQIFMNSIEHFLEKGDVLPLRDPSDTSDISITLGKQIGGDDEGTVEVFDIGASTPAGFQIGGDHEAVYKYFNPGQHKNPDTWKPEVDNVNRIKELYGRNNNGYLMKKIQGPECKDTPEGKAANTPELKLALENRLAPMVIDEIVRYACEVSGGSQGSSPIVHRDLNPTNIRYVVENNVITSARLIDWGVVDKPYTEADNFCLSPEKIELWKASELEAAAKRERDTRWSQFRCKF
ncbi:hypothetical protein DL96DRAFT_1810744 [Flagelloscypha sp. PMI_526]|nr:hypothetical protein DL96DRAFT_1810744 [Flagelloscypha sp. PMI_526]